MSAGDVHEVPAVCRTLRRTVAVELSAEHAEVLARVLAHYDVLTSVPASALLARMFDAADLPEAPALDPTDGYEHPVWHHTLVRLITEAALVDRRPAPLVAEVVDVALAGTDFAGGAR